MRNREWPRVFPALFGLLLAAFIASPAAAFDEGFEDITLLPGAGWVMQNNSDPQGTTDWFHGSAEAFPAHEGPVDSYIAANFNNAGGAGTISNWLLTPEFEFNNGTKITFWTRKPADSDWADRLQVRLSTAGASVDVGTGATDVGAFTELLLEINPDQIVGGYPDVWTEFTLTLDDSHEGFSGRVAFRYFVENGGPDGTDSDYIGIDTFSVTQAEGPPPGALDVNPTTLAFGEVTLGDDASLSFTVSNVAAAGTATLELATLALSGDTEFAITGGDCTVGTKLAPGEDCSVEVAFTPLAVGTYAGQVEVATTGAQTDTVTLSGEGVQRPDVLFRDRFEAP